MIILVVLVVTDNLIFRRDIYEKQKIKYKICFFEALSLSLDFSLIVVVAVALACLVQAKPRTTRAYNSSSSEPIPDPSVEERKENC